MFNSFKIRNIKKTVLTGILAGMVLSNNMAIADDFTIKDLDKSSDYAKEAIVNLTNQKIIQGDEHGYFNPNKTLTRAEMVTLIVRVLGLDIDNIPSNGTFTDVPKGHWANPYIEAAHQEGIVNGISKDYFDVDGICTREEMTTLFVRALGITPDDIRVQLGRENLDKLEDKNQISDWAKDYVEFAMAKGIIHGTTNVTFHPKGNAPREQAAVVTYRFLRSKDDILSSITDKKTIKEIAKYKDSVVMLESFNYDNQPISQGSGFYIGNGLFVTNYNVLLGSNNFVITDNEGDRYEVEGIARYDEDMDFAVVKTKEMVNMEPLKIGSSDMISKGDQIVTIGNPQGLQNTVSDGTVSGRRNLRYGYNGNLNLIQITTPISEESSGGALFNIHGYVVGITSDVMGDGELNFAIPIDNFKEIIDQLKFAPFENIKVYDMSDEIDGYLDKSDASIKFIINKAFKALEDENLNAFMSTVHHFNPSYRSLPATYNELFANSNFNYKVTDIEVEEKDEDYAMVNVKYTLSDPDDSSFESIEIQGQYALAKEHGEWRIYFAQESLIEE
ncbi:S-layer homology domain-containing protein [Dethiothermospora halolimnae]|uniref:S-layer homology domain-containing protein n=1 Tax=Dethiothermospora halolimnae TaxID=3114390 RepID=UPI003CCC0164